MKQGCFAFVFVVSVIFPTLSLARELPPLNDVIPVELQREADSRKATRFRSLGFALDFESLPQSVDLRSRATSIKTQTKPWCTAYGLAAVMEINGGNADSDLSERHIWSRYRVYSARAAIFANQLRPVTPEPYWPLKKIIPRVGYKKAAHSYIKQYEYLDTDIKAVLGALAQGRAVYMATSVSESMAHCDVKLDAQSPNTGGGHAIAVTGYQLDPSIAGGGALLIKNSWGEDCAERGYQWVPFEYCSRKDSYCLFWDVTQMGHRD